MKKILFLIVLCLFFHVTALSAADRTITDSDDWITVNLNSGDVLTVILADDPEDGYDWTVGRYDDDILMLVSGPSASNGTSTTRFRAGNSGTTSLLLRYNTTSGAGIQDIEAFQVTVVVGGQ
jgi:predicted secreted protein